MTKKRETHGQTGRAVLTPPQPEYRARADQDKTIVVSVEPPSSALRKVPSIRLDAGHRDFIGLGSSARIVNAPKDTETPRGYGELRKVERNAGFYSGPRSTQRIERLEHRLRQRDRRIAELEHKLDALSRNLDALTAQQTGVRSAAALQAELRQLRHDDLFAAPENGERNGERQAQRDLSLRISQVEIDLAKMKAEMEMSPIPVDDVRIATPALKLEPPVQHAAGPKMPTAIGNPPPDVAREPTDQRSADTLTDDDLTWALEKVATSKASNSASRVAKRVLRDQPSVVAERADKAAGQIEKQLAQGLAKQRRAK